MTEVELVTIQDNHVFLRGRLPGDPLVRTLANGAEVTTFQLAVLRPEGAGARSDTLDCSCSTAALRRQIARCVDGDRLEVTGRLQRRFWRAGSGVGSRYEVEVETIRRLKRQ